MLVREDNNVEVVDKRGEDHAFDALSMGLMTLSDDGVYRQPILRSQVNLQLPRMWTADQEGNLGTGNFWDDLRKSNQVNNGSAEFTE